MIKRLFPRWASKSSLHESRFTPLFVAGAPRSGTTILHAIVCASEKTNGYITECSYFTAFMHPLLIGLNTFDVHTKHYFASRDALIQNHSDVLNNELSKIWVKTGRPEVLALKDPMLTPLIPHLAEPLPQAKFVVSVRDPRATISSRIEVAKRETQENEIADDQVRRFCDEYVHMYGTVANHLPTLGDRILIVDYRDVVHGAAFDKLTAFGVGRIDTNRIWSNTIANPTRSSSDVWATALHGKMPSVASIDRYREHLDSRTEKVILDICGPVARALGAL
jgi:Sulfotransferase family